METFDSSTNSMEQTTEIYIKKVLAGGVEDVRRRLIASMEAMGYDVIEDEPNIIGRRGVRGWAAWYGSADVLDYASVLTVRLKPVGQNSTRATFDYLVKHPMLNRGEKQIVAQEAKTIAALSKKQLIEKTCPVCETESTDDSKFCRKCGAPLTSEQAEIEILRMMAETRAGKTSIVASSLLMLLSTLLLALAFILNNLEVLKPKLFPVLLVFGGIGVLLAVISSFFGWNRLKRALEGTDSRAHHGPQFFPETLEANELSAAAAQQQLPPPRVTPASVTEGTTNLLDEEWTGRHSKEKVPVSSPRNTNNFD